MKQSNRIIASVILFTAVTTGTITAQQSTINTSADAAFVKNNLPSSTNMVTSTVPAANPKIEARFAALFPNASDLQWVAGADNYWVSFLNNGRKASACFTPKGKMNYAITVCDMAHMPEAFSKAIQKEYAAYSLLRAIEIKAHDAVAYQAILEDANGYVTLKYTADGIEKIQQVVKQ
ncbi:hypothetical protein ESA94_02230 [Lacibacter luteus]|uniref:Beta-lactamase-inhibitor-like PepSY-like domain-containing protein n=1 Tax=Lacibacter luteus TaxID=2508719 RepID=A0A4Q1CMA1_9BACT|nr:hypothetical protein [Lacibacter luteus]RXK61855.1 hypothetical protein ESA94_02230 [Lacibacter luteus]